MFHIKRDAPLRGNKKKLKGCLNFLLLSLIFLLCFFAWVVYATWPIRFNCRLTLVVDTPQGERTGTGVIEIFREYTDPLTRQFGFFAHTYTLGQAIVVDLGAKGPIFVTLKNDDIRRPRRGDPFLEMVESLFPQRLYHGTFDKVSAVSDSDLKSQWAAYVHELERTKPKEDVRPARLPMIVWFRDIEDPATVERVDPADISATLGPGYTLKSATLEVTDAPVSSGFKQTFPKLGTNGTEAYFPGNYDFSRPARTLLSTDFERDR